MTSLKTAAKETMHLRVILDILDLQVELIDMVNILFSREKVPLNLNVFKN